MGFEHYYTALRRYKATARRSLPEEQRAALTQCPDSAHEMRAHLNCAEDGEYYQEPCTERKCTRCNKKLEELVSAAERLAVPSIKYQQWGSVPYQCKDGRVIDNHDFVPAEASIDDFLTEFDRCPATLVWAFSVVLVHAGT